MANFSLQILHMYGESGMLAVDTAPKLAALVDKFDDTGNTVVIAEGDTWIPGPFLVGGADPSLNTVLGGSGAAALGRADVAILNALGTTVSALGNHEFDLGSPVVSSAIASSGAWAGAQFPFLTANLDFSADSSLRGLADKSIGGTSTNNFAGLETTAIKGKIAPYAIKTINGEKIGFVGATTFELLNKSSPNGTRPKDDNTAAVDANDIQEVAALVQAAIDAMKLQGVNKIIMVDQLDTIERNKALAPLLSGVDVMVAGGGHERLGNSTSAPAAFNGHDANYVDGYPLVVNDKDGNKTLIVTTDTEFTYLGRLNVDFDSNGNVIVANLDPTKNGAYAATSAVVEAVYNNGKTASQIITDSTMASKVKAIVDPIQAVVQTKDSQVFGFTKVYLEGDRVFGRAQEVNLGNITADANAWKAKAALGLGSGDVMISLKNGGGLRSSVGAIDEDGVKIGPLGVDGVKGDGAISQLDIENALRFDNKLVVFDVTPQGLLNILNYSAGLAAGNGGYNQLGGIAYSFDPTRPAGQKVRDVALLDSDGNVIKQIIDEGVILPGAPSTMKMMALNFTANDGDGYPIKANATNFKFLLDNNTLSGVIDPANPTANLTTNVPSNALGEQKAFQDYLKAFHGTADTAYNQADTAANVDFRVENLSTRADGFSAVTKKGGIGSDTMAGGILNDKMNGGLGSDKMYGFAGDDTMSGNLGNDTIDGGAGNDKLSGDAGNDTIYGGTGNDNITGDAGDDTLYGDAGNDFVSGGAGNDKIFGGAGSDKLRGGDGNDTFHFGKPATGTFDTIEDFASGKDKIGLLAADFGLKAGALASNLFVTGTAATAATQQFIFNTNTKMFMYDADGTNSGAAINIAKLDGGAKLVLADLIVL